MRRVSVVGCSGSGKTELARRLASFLRVPHIELDAIYHLPGWQEIDPASFMSQVSAIASTHGWVVDGNYRVVVSEGPVWQRADTVVWLDIPRNEVMRRVVARTVRRVVRREEMWSGNREPVSNLYAWDPEKSIIRWAWTTHHAYQERYSAAMSSGAHAHLRFVHLKSGAEATRWLGELEAQQAT